MCNTERPLLKRNPDRPLTSKGREDSLKTAEFLKERGISVDIIWHSLKTRARETARIFSGSLSPKNGRLQKEGLSPNATARDTFTELGTIQKDLMIVGHLPHLHRLASLAVLNDEAYNLIKFAPSCAVCLERFDEAWLVKFIVIPEML